MLIRPMRADDIPTVEQISDDGFYALETRTARAHWPAPERRSPERAAAWRERAAGILDTDPAGCWVADLDGRAVGFALSFRRDTTWFLASFGVRPDEQGHGIGRALLEAAMGHARGCLHAMFHASEDPGATRRYLAAGFELHPLAMLVGTPDLSACPDLIDIREATPADRDLMDSLDRRTRGAAHGPDHDWLSRHHAALVVDRHDRSGYAYVGNGAPVVIAATDRRTASDLLWAALRTGTGEAVTIGHVSGANQWALRAGAAAGLAVETYGYLGLRGMKPPAPYLGHGALM